MPGWTPDWLGWWGSSDYDVARQVLQRGVGALLVLAFAQMVTQFRPLLGEHGMLPVPAFVARVPFRVAPSVFHWRYSDRLAMGVGVAGAVLAASVVAGLPQRGPWWVPTVVLLVCWALYLSVVDVGQRFYGFGWEMLLCEATFLVAWLGSDAVAVPWVVVVASRWLLFRLELGAGLIKWRGGHEWRDLTALDYHHETQPMPGPFSWHAHHLPHWWHRIEVVGNHVTQLGVPWLLLLPQPFPSVAGAVVVLTQGWLVLTGNFAWLNWAAIVLGAGMVSDGTWQAVGSWVGIGPGPSSASAVVAPTPSSFLVAVAAVGGVWLALSWRPARNLVGPRQLMNASFEPLRLVNAYGAFGRVTRLREEVVVEGTSDGWPGPEAVWREYLFKGKPCEVGRRPPQVAPWHLRLDWSMWFIPLGSPSGWFVVFLRRLLEADPATLRLLRVDPFGGVAPRWVRARLFRYRFSSREERRASGAWWVRDDVMVLVDPFRL
ncbi:lipase maturation factor family protein [Xylanimonas sp. McL0601]|uniref:lipase maturation factor family protein n=1 Tax=Xylanimonas sp. McL0601 TaxID=3414739 RepID=UPI003CEF1946